MIENSSNFYFILGYESPNEFIEFYLVGGTDGAVVRGSAS